MFRAFLECEGSADVARYADGAANHHPTGPRSEFVHMWRIEMGREFRLAAPLFNDEQHIGAWWCLGLDACRTLESAAVVEAPDFSTDEWLERAEVLDERVTRARGDREFCEYVNHRVGV